jgi:hypothetical protein
LVDYYATSRKIAGLNPDEVFAFFALPNPFSSIIALGLTQPITERSIGNIPVGEGGVKSGQPARPTTSLPSLNLMFTKCGIPEVSQSHRSPWCVTWIASSLSYYKYDMQCSHVLGYHV